MIVDSLVYAMLSILLTMLSPLLLAIFIIAIDDYAITPLLYYCFSLLSYGLRHYLPSSLIAWFLFAFCIDIFYAYYAMLICHSLRHAYFRRACCFHFLYAIDFDLMLLYFFADYAAMLIFAYYFSLIAMFSFASKLIFRFSMADDYYFIEALSPLLMFISWFIYWLIFSPLLLMFILPMLLISLFDFFHYLRHFISPRLLLSFHWYFSSLFAFITFGFIVFIELISFIYFIITIFAMLSLFSLFSLCHLFYFAPFHFDFIIFRLYFASAFFSFFLSFSIFAIFIIFFIWHFHWFISLRFHYFRFITPLLPRHLLIIFWWLRHFHLRALYFIFAILLIIYAFITAIYFHYAIDAFFHFHYFDVIFISYWLILLILCFSIFFIDIWLHFADYHIFLHAYCWLYFYVFTFISFIFCLIGLMFWCWCCFTPLMRAMIFISSLQLFHFIYLPLFCAITLLICCRLRFDEPLSFDTLHIYFLMMLCHFMLYLMALSFFAIPRFMFDFDYAWFQVLLLLFRLFCLFYACLIFAFAYHATSFRFITPLFATLMLTFSLLRCRDDDYLLMPLPHAITMICHFRRHLCRAMICHLFYAFAILFRCRYYFIIHCLLSRFIVPLFAALIASRIWCCWWATPLLITRQLIFSLIDAFSFSLMLSCWCCWCFLLLSFSRWCLLLRHYFLMLMLSLSLPPAAIIFDYYIRHIFATLIFSHLFSPLPLFRLFYWCRRLFSITPLCRFLSFSFISLIYYYAIIYAISLFIFYLIIFIFSEIFSLFLFRHWFCHYLFRHYFADYWFAITFSYASAAFILPLSFLDCFSLCGSLFTPFIAAAISFRCHYLLRHLFRHFICHYAAMIIYIDYYWHYAITLIYLLYAIDDYLRHIWLLFSLFYYLLLDYAAIFSDYVFLSLFSFIFIDAIVCFHFEHFLLSIFIAFHYLLSFHAYWLLISLLSITYFALLPFAAFSLIFHCFFCRHYLLITLFIYCFLMPLIFRLPLLFLIVY